MAIYFPLMNEFEQGLSSKTELSNDSYAEFLLEYDLVEALIDEADEKDDEELVSIYEEKLVSLERENPNFANQLKRDQLKKLDRSERQSRLMAAEAFIQSRHRKT